MKASRLPRIGMVLETGFPPDARVAREALALIEQGAEVHLLCGRGHESEPAFEIHRGIHVYRVHPHTVRLQGRVGPFHFSTRLPYRGLLRAILQRLNGQEPDWAVLIRQFLRDVQPDVLHVHDLRLLETAMAVARRQPHPPRVVADLHENYPALMGQLVTFRKGERSGVRKQREWQRREARLLPQTDRVLVVVEEARQRVRQLPGVSPNHVHVVENVVDAAYFQAQPRDLPKPVADVLQGRFVLSYVGYINGIHRGIQTILAALPRIREAIPHVLFVGAGGPREAYMDQVLRPLIQAHCLQDHVLFPGYCDETTFVPYIVHSHLGICPHLKTEITDTTFPNKVFLYGLFEKPLLVSHCVPLARYALETKGAMVFPAGDADALAEAIVSLYQDEARRTALGQRAHQAVMTRYQWDLAKHALLAAYADWLPTGEAKALGSVPPYPFQPTPVTMEPVVP